MPQAPGRAFGPYEIVGALGAGGMGEVYKARDSRLGRLVAIKVAKERFSDRFRREALAIAALNHPNICTLYDVGPDYLVMEYIEGKPLSGPLPFEKALSSAFQILAALEAAHRKGIVHRDLKPSNILSTNTGVKLLDFGLATIPQGENLDPAETTLLMTRENVILGTPQYMAPEQIEGKPADARADIFAFGTVFYELLTGRKAFEGSTPQSLMAAILTSEPRPLLEVGADVPPTIKRILDSCLEKNRENRWQSANDVRLALLAASTSAPPVARQQRIASTIIIAALLLAMIGLSYLLWRATPQRVAIRAFTVVPPLGTTDAVEGRMAPNGEMLAFVAGGRLWTRSLNSLTATPVPGSEDARHPFWSPDSQHLGFFAQGKLKRVDAARGSPEVVAAAPQPSGGAWWQHHDGSGFMVFADAGSLFRVNANGGAVTPVTKRRDGDRTHTLPEFLPDGRLLYTVEGISPDRGVVIARLTERGDAPERQLLISDGIGFGFVRATGVGVLLFARPTLFVQRFNLSSTRLVGEPVPIGTELKIAVPGFSIVSAAADGSAAVFMDRVEQTGEVIILNAEGKTQRTLSGQPTYMNNIRLSPDGTKVALTRLEDSLDVWIYELTRNTDSRITSHPAADGVPVWSPDGRQIAFTSWRDGIASIYVTSAAGGTPDRLLLKSNNGTYPCDWSSDGRHLLYQVTREGAGWDLWVAGISTGQKVANQRPYINSDFNEVDGRFSPDGRWIAYSSDETGSYEVYIRSFPLPAEKFKISNSGGSKPEWRGDGRELYYLSPERELMAVPIRLRESLDFGPNRKLFPVSANPSGLGAQYAVDQTGTKFVVLSRAKDLTKTTLAVVLNWRPGP